MIRPSKGVYKDYDSMSGDKCSVIIIITERLYAFLLEQFNRKLYYWVLTLYHYTIVIYRRIDLIT